MRGGSEGCHVKRHIRTDATQFHLYSVMKMWPYSHIELQGSLGNVVFISVMGANSDKCRVCLFLKRIFRE